MNFFSSKDESQTLKEQGKSADPESNNAPTGNSFTNAFRNVTSVFRGQETKSEPETFTDKLLSYIEVEKSYTSFFIVLGLGGFVLFLSMLFFPLAFIRPQKFVSLFSLGSFLTILSFIFIYGTKEYFKMLFNSSRALLSGLYFASIFIGIYFSFTDTWMIISHICIILQFITLITFVLSFLPGGSAGINFIWSTIKSFFVKS